ncbi:MAG: hypothetical protein IJU75_03275, partial [Clostridia bacterium]|nr:hypothetical protein [Clostridia bacterium]
MAEQEQQTEQNFFAFALIHLITGSVGCFPRLTPHASGFAVSYLIFSVDENIPGEAFRFLPR